MSVVRTLCVCRNPAISVDPRVRTLFAGGTIKPREKGRNSEERERGEREKEREENDKWAGIFLALYAIDYCVCFCGCCRGVAVAVAAVVATAMKCSPNVSA